MKTIFAVGTALTLMMLATPITAADCSEDVYTDIAGTVYVDDDAIAYIYLESNGQEGMQRDVDGNQDGHCASDNPDTWVF